MRRIRRRGGVRRMLAGIGGSSWGFRFRSGRGRRHSPEQHSQTEESGSKSSESVEAFRCVRTNGLSWGSF